MSTCFPKERYYQLLTELEQEREARQQAEAEVHKSMEIILNNDFTRDLSGASLHDTVKNICNELEECCCNAANLATSAAKLEQRAKQAEKKIFDLQDDVIELKGLLEREKEHREKTESAAKQFEKLMGDVSEEREFYEEQWQQVAADNVAIKKTLFKLLQAIDYFKTTRSPDMGGKHGIVIRVPQGEKGDYWHNAHSAAKAIAEMVLTGGGTNER